MQDKYRIYHISVQFPQQYADGYEGMVVSLNPGQKGESFVSTVQDYVKGKLAYDFNVNRNGHTVFILAGIAPLRLAEVKVYGEKLGPRSIDDDGKVYLKSVNGDVAGGVTRGTLRNVVQVGKRGMAYHISNEVGKEYRGELKYNMSSTIWSGANKQTGLAITDGPYWNSYLEKRNASNPSQRWIIERAPGSYVSSDGIVKNGDKVYVRRDTKAGESKIYLRTKSDGVLGLTNKENERTAFTIQEAP